MKFLVKEGLHHIIVLDILSVKPWSVNYKSSVKRQFDCRQTTCSYIDDWNRVLDAVTLLRTQWKLSDNMTSDLSKTSSLPIRLASCHAHLRYEAIFMTFLKILMKLSTCESIASRFRSRADDQVIREQEESLSRQKGGSHWRGYRYHARCPSNYHDENFSVSEILDDVTSCADIDFVLKYLTIFVVTSVFHLLRHTLLSGSVAINDVRISSDAFLSTDDTYCIA